MGLSLTQKQKNCMKNGYDICWTDYALEELNQTISYLELNFTKKKKSLKTKNPTSVEIGFNFISGF